LCTVTAAEPGRSFAFAVKLGPIGIADWAYAIAPTAQGCRVTETWTDRRSRFIALFGKPASGVSDRGAHNKATMTETLDRLAAAAEAPAS
jgi:hypothetical protein